MNSASHPDHVRREFAENEGNGKVGSVLVSETDKVRVWHIDLKPGERLPVHKHVLDYFWTALTAGTGRSHQPDGSISENEYDAGETKHLEYGPGESMMHDLENIGTTDLRFVTVEFKTGKNEPLQLS
jgi:beta-alanine degradation protein BauB